MPKDYAVAGLRPKHVPLIKESHVPYLRGIDQIQALNTQALFEKLTAEDKNGHINQMSSISDPQLAWVTAEQIKGLNNEQLLKLKAMPRWKIENLGQHLVKKQIEQFNSIELISLISASQINSHLSHSQVPFLIEKWQIQECPNKWVYLLAATQVNSVKPAQVPYLKGKIQIHALTDKNLFNLLTAEEENPENINQMSFISTTQCQWVSPTQVKGLTNERLLELKNLQRWKNEKLRNYLKKEQIQTFDSNELVKLLSTKQIYAHLIQEQVGFLIQEKQLQHTDCLVSDLSVDQIRLIKSTQVPFVEGQTQVQTVSCTSEFVSQFQKRHLRDITAAQAALLTPAQIRLIDTTQELSKLTRDQWIHLSPTGFALLSRTDIESIQNDSAFL